MKKLSSWAKALTLLLLMAYTGICIFFYVIQESIIFRPQQLSQAEVYSYRFPFEERWFEPEEGVRIHAIHAYSEAPEKKGLVVYLHGNRGNNRTNETKFYLFLEQGYDVLYPDYREYGKSTGELENEQDLTGDIQHLYEAMTREYAEDRIILLGYSLGTGIAARVAAMNDPRHVILWAPYYSLIDMKDSQYPFLPDWLVRYPLETGEALQEIEEPVTLFFAADDRVLPVERSMKLTQYLKPGDESVMLEGQGHGWIYRNPELRGKMLEILNRDISRVFDAGN